METQKAANALERVQSDKQEKVVDSASAQKALQGLSASGSAGTSTTPVVKIKIREEDIKVLMAELEIDRAEAEKILVSTAGDFKEALYNVLID